MITIEVTPDGITGLASVLVSGIDISRTLQFAQLASTKNPARFIRDEIIDLCIRGLIASKQDAARLSVDKDSIQRTIDSLPQITVKV